MKLTPFRKLTTGLNLILAPLVYLAGQYLLSRWEGQEPDAIWFLSHTLLLIGATLFIPAITRLTNYLADRSPILTSLGGILAFFGALALIGQFAIDLAVGQIAANQAEMTVAFQSIRAAPAISLVFYTLAPICLFIGLLLIILLLATARLIPLWIGMLALLGFIGIGVAVAANSAAIFMAGFAGLALVGPLRVGLQILSTPSATNSYQPLPDL
jgi:hypothetical protein